MPQNIRTSCKDLKFCIFRRQLRNLKDLEKIPAEMFANLKVMKYLTRGLNTSFCH